LNNYFDVEFKKHFFLTHAVKKAKTDLTIPEYFNETSAAVSETMSATASQLSSNQLKTGCGASRTSGVIAGSCKEQSKKNIPENRKIESNLMRKIMIDFN